MCRSPLWEVVLSLLGSLQTVPIWGKELEVLIHELLFLTGGELLPRGHLVGFCDTTLYCIVYFGLLLLYPSLYVGVP